MDVYYPNYVFIVVDTCTFSNIMNGRKSSDVKLFYKKLFSCDTRPCITDLTFIELVNGCKDLSRLKILNKNLNECEFLIYGRVSEVKKLIKEKTLENIDVTEFEKIKKKLSDIKNKALFEIFQNIVIKYCLLYYSIMEFDDPTFWEGISNLFILHQKESDNTKKLVFDSYKILLNKKAKSEDILFDIANAIANYYLTVIKNKSFDPNYVESYVSNNKTRDYLSKKTGHFVSYLKRNYNQITKKVINKNDQLLFLMEYLKDPKVVEKNDLENELLNDAINYVVIKSGFCKGKFYMNHLVDLYNVLVVGNKNNLFYISNDKFWNNFIDDETKINSRLINKMIRVDGLFE